MCCFIYDLMEPKLWGNKPSFAPSVVVLSLMHEFLDFIFKSPGTTTKSELDSARVSRVSSKLSANF